MCSFLKIQLPEWVETFLSDRRKEHYITPEEKMELAIGLSQENVENKAGGPFGAAIFDEQEHSLISVGVNCVVPENTSMAHAEVMAIVLAQKKLQNYDLASDENRRFALYTSSQPCIMCFGSIWWSGLEKLACGARAEDVESIVGFEEGPVPEDWIGSLENRLGLPKVEVQVDLLRSQACDVLKAYAESGMPVYNAGSTS